MLLLTSTTRTGGGDGLSGGQEKTSTDGTRDGDHDHVAQTEVALETLLGSVEDLSGADVDILHLVDLVLFGLMTFKLGHVESGVVVGKCVWSHFWLERKKVQVVVRRKER